MTPVLLMCSSTMWMLGLCGIWVIAHHCAPCSISSHDTTRSLSMSSELHPLHPCCSPGAHASTYAQTLRPCHHCVMQHQLTPHSSFTSSQLLPSHLCCSPAAHPKTHSFTQTQSLSTAAAVPNAYTPDAASPSITTLDPRFVAYYRMKLTGILAHGTMT